MKKTIAILCSLCLLVVLVLAIVPPAEAGSTRVRETCTILGIQRSAHVTYVWGKCYATGDFFGTNTKLTGLYKYQPITVTGYRDPLTKEIQYAVLSRG